MKVSIRIPVADLSLDQACIYHLRAHHKIEYTAQTTRISTCLTVLFLLYSYFSCQMQKKAGWSQEKPRSHMIKAFQGLVFCDFFITTISAK